MNVETDVVIIGVIVTNVLDNNVLAGVLVDVGAGVLDDVEIIIEALADVLASVIFAVVTSIGVDVLADVNVVLAAMITDFEFAMPVLSC